MSKETKEINESEFGKKYRQLRQKFFTGVEYDIDIITWHSDNEIRFGEYLFKEAQKEAYLEIKKDLEDTDLNDEDCRNMLKVVVNTKIEDE